MWPPTNYVIKTHTAEPGGRAVYGVDLRPLRFESPGGKNVFLLWLLCVVR